MCRPRLPWPDNRLCRPAAADDHHHLYFAKTLGGQCAVTNYMECPRYVPNSCVNTVLRFSPGDTTLPTAFTIPGSPGFAGFLY